MERERESIKTILLDIAGRVRLAQTQGRIAVPLALWIGDRIADALAAMEGKQ
jgi:hypothetical protein